MISAEADARIMLMSAQVEALSEQCSVLAEQLDVQGKVLTEHSEAILLLEGMLRRMEEAKKKADAEVAILSRAVLLLGVKLEERQCPLPEGELSGILDLIVRNAPREVLQAGSGMRGLLEHWRTS